MAITINTGDLKTILETTPSTQNILLVGKHGIGKSEIITRHFEDQGIPVIALFLGQMSDPGDLIGLPNKDEKTGKTEFMPPYWFPMDDKPAAEVPKTALQQQIDDYFKGKKWQYHLTEDEEEGRRELHIRLSRGKAMIIDLNQRGDVFSRIDHDLAYIPRLAELAKLFPYRLTGPRKKVEWITSPTEN